jgi:hypothetical protein
MDTADTGSGVGGIEAGGLIGAADSLEAPVTASYRSTNVAADSL